ncbi:hypothetical protein [Streptomyces sp. NPDC058751]|uniref:hypothetical protein n=1 Tax=Streptomyces sp. NPDC058751 TaxID=3346623 RepID=UPI0036AC7151
MSAAPGCVTETKKVNYGYGTITVCVNEDGSARAYSDLRCVAFGAVIVIWEVDWKTTSGVKVSEVASAGWNHNDIAFDVDPSTGTNGIKGIIGVDEIRLSTLYMCPRPARA